MELGFIGYTIIGILLFYTVTTIFKRKKKLSKGTKILITGGVQGIGKQLAVNFADNHMDDVTLIIIDIRDDLK